MMGSKKQKRYVVLSSSCSWSFNSARLLGVQPWITLEEAYIPSCYRKCTAKIKNQSETNNSGQQTKLLQNRFSFKTGHILVVWHASHWSYAYPSCKST
jgi:hypothetical protein